MKKRGKKTDQWDRIRRQLIIRFQLVGLTYCELQYQGCWRDNGLTFAHRKKRRLCDEDELHICVMACQHCHDKVEYIGHEAMFQVIQEVIENRSVQP